MSVIPSTHGQINWRFGGSACPTGAEVTCGFIRIGEDSPDESAEKAHAAWVEHIVPLVSAQCVLLSTHIKFGPNETGPMGDWFQTNPGSTSVANASPNVALLVKKSTALGGRKGSGRMYVPGVNDDQLEEGGLLGPAALTGFRTGFEALYTQLVDDEMTPALLESVATSRGAIAITGFSAQPLVATQRRRLRR